MVKQPDFGTFELLNESVTNPEEAIVFIGQLFAWAYLSRNFPEEIRPNILDIDLESTNKTQLEEYLRALSKLKLSEPTARELKLIDNASDSRKELREQARMPMVFRFNFALLERITDGEIEAILTQLNRISLLTLVPYETVSEQLKKALIANAKRAGWFGPPMEVASLMCGLANITEADSVYCPHALSYHLAELAAEITGNVSVELIQMVGAGAVLRPFYLVNLLNGSKIHLGRTSVPSIPAFSKDGHIPEFSKTICVLPWGRKIGLLDDLVGLGLPRRQTTEEIFYIRHALAQTTGTAVFLVSNSVLFHSGIEEQVLRRDLVESRKLKAVIGLPDGLFPNTSLGTSILVIDQQKSTDEVIFADATSETFHRRVRRARLRDNRRGVNQLNRWETILKTVSEAHLDNNYLSVADGRDIAEKDYNLLPNRYVLDPAEKELDKMIRGTETKNLGEIASVIRAQAVKNRDESDSANNYFLEIRVSDIEIDGSIVPPNEEISVSRDKIGRARKMLVKPGDILVSVKGTIGKVGLVGDDMPENAVPSQSFVILRLDASETALTPVALFAFLSSGVVRRWFKTRATGTVMKSLSSKDIRSMAVPMVDRQFVSRIRQNYEKLVEMSSELNTLQMEVIYAQDTMWPQPSDEAQ